MKILCIVPNVPGLTKLFYDGKIIDYGMPSMFKPIEYFIKNGDHVNYFIYPHYKLINKDFFTEVNNVRFISVKLIKEPFFLKVIRKLSLGYINIFPFLEASYLSFKIYNSNKHFDYDIIYGQDNLGILSGFLLSKILKIPLVTRLYGVSFMRRAKGKITFLNKIKYWDKYISLKLKSKLLIITNDGSITRDELNQINPSSDKVNLWFNGYHKNFKISDKLKIKNKKFTLISISHLSDWKNTNLIIEIFNIIVKKGYDWDLLIIGEGIENKNLKKLTEKYNLESNINFTGQIPKDDIYNYLKVSDVFISLYDRQNLTNTLWEAMSMGKCILTRSEFDINKTIIKHGDNGYLYPIDDLNRIAERLIKVSKNKTLLGRIGYNAKKTVEKLLPSWDERVNNEYISIKKIIDN